MTTIAISVKTIKSRVTFKNLPKINWKIMYFLGVLLSLALLISYVLLVNELTGGVYMIRDYNQKLSDLLEENQYLETELARTSFLSNVMEKVKEMNFEKTANVKYVKIMDNSLAKVK